MSDMNIMPFEVIRLTQSLNPYYRVWQPCEYLRWKDTSAVLFVGVIRGVTLNPRKINKFPLKPFLFDIANRSVSAYGTDFVVVLRFSKL